MTAAVSTTLPLYWSLSSAKKAERLDASAKLISALQQFQDGFKQSHPPQEESKDESSSGEENDSEEFERYTENLDQNNATDVAYAIRRLIRGLASARESSRLGFAVALTELLSRLETVTSLQVLSLLKNSSQTTAGMSGQEERDVLFARLFGLKAIINSGLLFREKPLSSSSTSPGSLKAFETVLSELLGLGESKSWLKESSWWTLDSLLDHLLTSSVPWKEEAFDLTLDRVYVGDKSWGPEKVAFTLRVQKSHPGKDWKKLCGGTFKAPLDILAAANLPFLSRVLKEAIVEDDDGETINTTPWKPQLHYVWDVILDALLSPNETRSSSCDFQDFYRISVDESLFASSASPQRKYWGFQIFQKALKKVSPSGLPFLFTQNFMRSWINHLAKGDRYLHKIARQVASDVQELTQNNPTVGFTLVLQLTGTNGSQNFDRITNTKTVETILGSMDIEGVKEYLKYLLQRVNEEGEGIAARRSWIIEQMAILLRRGTVPKDEECTVTIIHWLTTHAFFTITKKDAKSSNTSLHVVPEPAISDEHRELCRTKLMSSLADLSTTTISSETNDKDTKRRPGVSSTGETWVRKALQTYAELQKDGKHVKAVHQLEDDHMQLLEKVLKTTAHSTEDKDRFGPSRGIELLFCAIALRNITDKVAQDQWDILKDCMDSSSSLLTKSSPNKKKRKSETPEQEPIDVVVDTIIGLLEHSTSFSRTMANQSFSMITPLVKEGTMDLILVQLERRDPTAEEDEDEDEEMEDVDVDDASEDSSDEDEDEDDDANEDEEIDEEEVAELRKKLDLAMNGKEDGTGNEEDGSDSDEGMDDDQMMAMDEQLAAVFKSRTSEIRKGAKDVDAQREATHFKNRVLDLVETFIRKEASNSLVIRCISPLIDVISTSSNDEKQFSDKAKGIIRSQFGKPKEVPEISDTSDAVKLLESLHERARKLRTSELLPYINLCSVYLGKVLHGTREDDVARIYKESMVDFATRKSSSLNPAFFLDFIRKYPSTSWKFRAASTEMLGKAINGYRQTQIFAFIQAQLSAMPNDESKADEVFKFIGSVSSALQRVISDACTSEKPALSASQLKETLKMGLQLCRLSKRIPGSSLDRIGVAWKPSSWLQLASQLSKSAHFKDSSSAQASCRQIAQIAQGDGKDGKSSKSKKRKTEGDGEAPATEDTSRRKRLKKKAQAADQK